MFLTIDGPGAAFYVLVVIVLVLSIFKIILFLKKFITKSYLFKLLTPAFIFVGAVLLALIPLGTVQNVWILFLFLVGQWIFLFIQIADIIKTSLLLKEYFVEEVKKYDEMEIHR